MSNILPDTTYYLLPIGREFNARYLVKKAEYDVPHVTSSTFVVRPQFYFCKQQVNRDVMFDLMCKEETYSVAKVLVREFDEEHYEIAYLRDIELYRKLFGSVFVVDHYGVKKTIHTNFAIAECNSNHLIYETQQIGAVNLLIADNNTIDTLMALWEQNF